MPTAATNTTPRMTHGETRRFQSMKRRGYLMLFAALFFAAFLVMTVLGAGGLHYTAQWLLTSLVASLLGLVLAFLNAAKRVEQKAALRAYGSAPRFRPTAVISRVALPSTHPVAEVDPDSEITQLIAGDPEHHLAA